MATNIGKISFCKLRINGINIIDEEGFRSFDLGEASGTNTSVSGGAHTYAIVDDIETGVYRNASIVVLEGSYMQIVLTTIFELNNYGSETNVVLTKNSNKASTLGEDLATMKIRCLKGPGQRTGYAVTQNGDEVALVTFNMELELLSEAVI